MSYFPKEAISIKTIIAEISEEMVALRLYGLVGIIDQIIPSYVKVIPIYEKISGATLAFAAILLILPGFATDVLGILLVFPITRKLLFS